MNYLSSLRHVSPAVEDCFSVANKYRKDKWQYVIDLLSNTQQITNSGLKIAEVMKEKLNIELFPSVFKVASRGWDRGGGTASFMMYGFDCSVESDSLEMFLFYDPAAKYKSKRAEYSMDNNNQIIREYEHKKEK